MVCRPHIFRLREQGRLESSDDRREPEPSGRYTGYKSSEPANDPVQISKYVNLLDTYRSTVGLEIINKIDNESRYDRILWDNILKEIIS